MKVAIVAAIGSLSLATGASAQVIRSDFESGLDGWKTLDYISGSSQATPGWNGHAITTGDTAALTAFTAPSPKFTGNLSSYFGGTVSFDLQDTFVSTSTSTSYTLAIGSGSSTVTGGTVLYWYGGQPATADFRQFSALLSTTDTRWRLGGGPNGGGTVPTAAQFMAVLSDVRFIYVNADWLDGPDDLSRLDNFTVSAVPEPSTYVMFAIGLVGVFGIVRRQKKIRLNRST